jgi:EAL domain-containing protein (putative c-di-GMP-specific phosphodiesterase class I)
MPLTELIRYFNSSDLAGESTLYSEGERVAAWHRGVHLRSLFQPIIALASQRIVGHQAFLSASLDNGSPLSSEHAYQRQTKDSDLVHFDRLCRTLHALNFLAQRRHTGGHLQLSIHPRHLLAVHSQHGLVFEAILRRCGLAPDDIVLELSNDELSQDPRWLEAVGNYRNRGYRIALNGQPAGDFVPDIRKGTLAQLSGHHSVLRHVHDVANQNDLASVKNENADWVQGPLFGLPQADCLATHNRNGVAYNAKTLVPEVA